MKTELTPEQYMNLVYADPKLKLKFLEAMVSWLEYNRNNHNSLFLCNSINNVIPVSQYHSIDLSVLKKLGIAIPKKPFYIDLYNQRWLWDRYDFRSRKQALEKAIEKCKLEIKRK